MIEYPYALNSDGTLIHISKVPDGHTENYYCPYCHADMTPACGPKNQHHFKHKPIDDERKCSGETYLHELAKLLLADKLRIKNNFFIKFDANKREGQDITLYYDDVDVEKQVTKDGLSFRPDILLRNSEDRYPQLFIEIANTHYCEQKKIDSHIPIIEISINSLNDLEWLQLLSFIDTTKRYYLFKFHNFNSISKYVLYYNQIKRKYEKIFYENISFINRNNHDENVVFEVVFDKNVPNNDDTNLLFLTLCHKNGFRVSNCQLCSRFPCLISPSYKKQRAIRIDQYPQRWKTEPRSCQGYSPTPERLEIILSKFSDVSYSVWKAHHRKNQI